MFSIERLTNEYKIVPLHSLGHPCSKNLLKNVKLNKYFLISVVLFYRGNKEK